MPLPQRPEGVVWIDAVAVVPDEHGNERLLGHYSRRKGLADELEHGIAVFDDEKPCSCRPGSFLLTKPGDDPAAMRFYSRRKGKSGCCTAAQRPMSVFQPI